MLQSKFSVYKLTTISLIRKTLLENCLQVPSAPINKYKSGNMETCVNIKLEIDVVTGETVAHFVTSILEFLLYQRNQIPFVCKTFKYLISRWDKNGENVDVPTNFQVQRERILAKQTLDSINAMRGVIRKVFDETDVSCVRFLFGSTPYTPKEVYTINLPSIRRRHLYEHHKLKTASLNQALLSLLTSHCLYDTLSANLLATNLFLELKMPDIDATGLEQLISKDLWDLPANCKKVVINLVHTLPDDYVEKKCCGEMKVFQDISTLSLDDDMDDDMVDLSKQVGWWEASTIVRGFQEKNLNGGNMWQ